MNSQDFVFKLPESNVIYEKNDSILTDSNKYIKLTTEGVNNVVAAFYIKSILDNKNMIKDCNYETKCTVTDNFYNEVNETITNNQLNYVNDIIKNIDKKMNDIIEKDYTK